jgi:DNA-binding LacI/PurR family transcriptional regulator
VGDVLREREKSLLIQTVRAGGPREHLLLPVLQNRVDGALVLVSGEPQLRRWYVEQLAGRDRPFVVFDEVLDDPSILSVRAADRDAGRMLTEYLQAKGHERIAFIGARVPWAVVEQRQLGYADALRAAGTDVEDDLQLFEAGWQPAGGAEMARRLLSSARPPTAIVCGSDVLAIGAMQAADGMGLQVPDDVAVAGFDDFQFSAWARPSLTTVRVQAYEMGRVGATMLLDELDGKPLEMRQVVLPVELVRRESA